MKYKEFLDEAIKKIYENNFFEAIELLNESIKIKNDLQYNLYVIYLQ